MITIADFRAVRVGIGSGVFVAGGRSIFLVEIEKSSPVVEVGLAMIGREDIVTGDGWIV
jgi:hypothetical protein